MRRALGEYHEKATNVDRALGSVYRSARQKLHWSIEHLAAYVQLTPPMMGNYENGKNRPRVSLHCSICIAMGLSPIEALARAEIILALKSGNQDDIETSKLLVSVISAFNNLQTLEDRRHFHRIVESYQGADQWSCEAPKHAGAGLEDRLI